MNKCINCHYTFIPNDGEWLFCKACAKDRLREQLRESIARNARLMKLAGADQAAEFKKLRNDAIIELQEL